MKNRKMLTGFVALLSTLFMAMTVAASNIPTLKADKSTQMLLQVKHGNFSSIKPNKLKIDNRLPKTKADFVKFDGKMFEVIKSAKAFDLGDDFTIEAVIRRQAGLQAGFNRIISRANFNPRGGYELALRKNGTLSVWVSGKSWCNSNIVVPAGKWSRVGVMGRGNVIYLFSGDNFSNPIVLKSKPILPTTANIVLGKDFEGDIATIRISNAALYMSAATPGGKDWAYPTKYFKDNGLRGAVILNAFWSGRKIGSGTPFGKYRLPDDRINRKGFEYYREFTVPKQWNGRQLELEFGDFSQNGRVLLDNKEVLKIERRKYNISYTIPKPKQGGEKYRLGIETGYVKENIWLRSYPNNGFLIDDSFIETSYRQKAVRIKLAGIAKPGNGKVALTVKIYPFKQDSKSVLTFSGDAKINSDGRWNVTLNSPWKNPQLWSRQYPNLYQYVVELHNAKGELVDELLPRRFGFREVWLEKGRLVINGHPITAFGDSSVQGENTTSEHFSMLADSYKKLGLSAMFRVTHENSMNIADEKGLLLNANVGSLVRINIWDPKSGLINMSGSEVEEDIIRRVKAIREHPSIIMYASNAPFAINTVYAGQVGQNSYFPGDYFPGNRNTPRVHDAYKLHDKSVNLIKSIDPTRPVAGGVGSGNKDVEFVTHYLCANPDLQSREDFFGFWLRSGRPKMIWSSEFGIPFQGHDYIRRTSFQHPHTRVFPKIHLEAAARYFGDRVYLEPSQQELEKWLKIRYAESRTLPVMVEKTALFATNQLRAWRTAGIWASGHHLLSTGMFEHPKSNNFLGIPMNVDPRRPGLSRVLNPRDFPIVGKMKPLASGKAFMDAMALLKAYIGGGAGKFTNKDHLYFAGAPIKKSLIVLNDYDLPINISGKWLLKNLNGKIVKSGLIAGKVQPGEREFDKFPIEFDAPAVAKRTDFTLEIAVEAQPNLAGALSDTFKITVFPKHQTPKVAFNGTIWRLNISDNRIHERRHVFINRDNRAFLNKAGITSRLIKGLKTFNFYGTSPWANFTINGKDVKWGKSLYNARKLVEQGTPKPGDILIIPRHCLESSADTRQLNLRLLKKLGLDKLIEQGLKVIVFEQNLSNIFGMNTEKVRPRRTFSTAKGHPILNGLNPSDLTYWTGASNLTGALDEVPSPSDKEFPERVWHISNMNSVATKTLIRPQLGSARAIVVSGFDLMETPLLEVTRGKGRIIFCQMDVTNRYGIDPAATRIVDNIFKYITTVGTPDPAKNALIQGAAGKFGIIAEKKVFRALKPQGNAGWGITQGELFFRESIYKNNWITKKLPNVTVPVFPSKSGLPTVVKWDKKSGKFILSLSEDDFNTGWMKRKVAWIRSALIVNQGGSLESGPALDLQGNKTALYPIVWVDGFLHPYSAELW